MARKAKRFINLDRSISNKPGVFNPAAYIGRKKYGNSKLSKRGRK